MVAIDRDDLWGYDGQPPQGIAPWNRPENRDGKRHRWLTRMTEWLPRPVEGRTLPLERRRVSPTPIYVQIVPGPGNLFQIVRVDLAQPVARGFRSKEHARKWIAFALRGGMLPEGVVELENGPPTDKED